MGYTLDAGALIAADRGDRRFWLWWRLQTTRHVVLRVPAPVIAQAWRGPRNARMQQLLAACDVVPMGSDDARRTGLLCGKSRTHDVVDAFVVIVAAAHRDDVITSDPDDLRALAPHARGIGAVWTLDDL